MSVVRKKGYRITKDSEKNLYVGISMDYDACQM
jgi:hypothetical protein